jgi:hypothetical protein
MGGGTEPLVVALFAVLFSPPREGRGYQMKLGRRRSDGLTGKANVFDYLH